MNQRLRNLLGNLGPIVGLLLFAGALAVLHHQLKDLHYHDVVRSLRDIPAGRLLLALGLTAGSYLALTGYEALAFRHVGHPVPYARTAMGSFIGYAFSNSVGFPLLSGGSIRYRLYSAWGIPGLELAQVLAFITLTVWLGILALAGTVFTTFPVPVPGALGLPLASTRPVGMAALALLAAYLAWTKLRKTPLRFRGWEFQLPSPRMSLAQVAVAALDLTMVCGVLYALLPTGALGFPEFLGIYLLALVAGAVSHVPGGLGVFETVLLALLGPRLPASEVMGALVAYRGLYYLLPLAAASLLLGLHEFLAKRQALGKALGVFGQWAPGMAPRCFALTTFLAGAILLLSGATPANGTRLEWLKDFLPLPVMELSHFLASLTGAGLLFLAWGLRKRLDAAWLMTVCFLGGGVVFSLLKGFEAEQAAVLAVMLAALLPCRGEFYRKTSLTEERFTGGWLAAVALVLCGTAWLGLFSFKHVAYSHDLWWRFSLHGNAPRALRAAVGIAAAALCLGLARLMRPSRATGAAAQGSDLERAKPVIQASPRTSAGLALLGDKRFLFGENGRAFLMYAVSGRSWIALGDPVGPEDEWPELIWQFRERCDEYGGWPVFYQVGKESLHLYLELGLAFLKLGEEARVPLEGFSLEGKERRALRHAVNKLEKEGCVFEVVPVDGVAALLPELKRISDAWLTEKHTQEKGFSLGFFDEAYVKQFPVAVVRKEGRILAFANLWLGAGKEELSLDLMRYAEAPPGIMDYLFAKLMLWGREQGFRRFSLGGAPLSGLEARPLAPRWTKAAAFVFRHGEHFYNFQGLRQYKEKFDPAWEPVYLASPGGLALPRILADLVALISGGIRGAVAK